MKFQCDCGEFIADTGDNWRKSPGRLMCYCDNCQDYVGRLGRTDVLDEYGGTEVIPLYPNDISIIKGADKLCYTKLTEKGPVRLSTSCCNAPILNTRANFPWAGVFNTAFLAADPNATSQFGDIRARIMTKFAKSPPPFKTSEKIAPRDMLVVMPFVIKGKLTGKHKNSPFFESDGTTPIAALRSSD